MPLFKQRITAGGGQSFDVLCPRCREVIPAKEVHQSGEGVGIRVVEGDYLCECNYSVKVIERIPRIQGDQL